MTTTTTDTKKSKTITVTMSERAPVTIQTGDWPKIASADDHDGGQLECQANTEWYICVLQHEDGRRLVYGWEQAGNGGQYASYRPSYAGFLVDVPKEVKGDGSPADMRLAHGAWERARETETIRAIRRVAGVIGHDDIAQVCISDLPAEEL